MSNDENVWRRSGGDWRIGRAERKQETRGIRQSAELHTYRLTLGAMSTAVKQYNVGLNRWAIPARCDARWIGNGAAEL